MFDGLPPALLATLVYYRRYIQLWDGVRERLPIGGRSTAWPPSSYVWYTGTITSVVDNGDGTISIFDSAAATAFSGAGWLDTLGNKRWTSCHQFDLNGDGALSGTGSEGGSGPNAFFEPDGYAPPSYAIVFFPPDVPNASHLGDPSRGFVYPIADNGDTFVKIADDGRLLLNPLTAGGPRTLSNYVGFRYQIIRYQGGGGTQQGFGFPQRYPPKPNDLELDYGIITAATGSTITDARTPDITPPGWNLPKNFNGALLAGKHIILKVGARWYRCTIAAASGNEIKFHFPGGGAPPGTPTEGTGYWIVEPDAFWRPEFRLQLDRVLTRSGYEWVFKPSTVPWGESGHPPWSILGTWYSGFTDQASTSHDPTADQLTSIPRFVDSIDVELSASSAAPCAVTPVTVFDVDANTSNDFTSPVDYCGNADHLYNPWLFWSLRGLDLAIEGLLDLAVWVERKSYTSAGAIPFLVWANWEKIWAPANTRTVTLDVVVVTEEVSLGINPDTGLEEFETVETDRYAAINITMPQATPFQGAYTDLPCYWVIFNAAGDVKASGEGTTTAMRLHTGSYVVEDPGDDGLTAVIAFGWTRKYERRVRRIYPREYGVPDTSFAGGLVWPPTENDPGEYGTYAVTGNAAEYTAKGRLEESGPAFIAGESYRYVGDNLFDPFPDVLGPPGELAAYLDAGYQGIPAPSLVSTFPRFKKTGTLTGGGPGHIEDENARWWVSPQPSVVHTLTATSGSSTTRLHDATQYKNWPTEIVNPGAPPPTIVENQLRLSRYWSSQGSQRFVGMILEVAVSGDGSADSPYVWERRPVTEQHSSGADETNPYLVVSPAFSETTLGRPAQLREPGYGNRKIIRNTWRGRKVKVTRREGGQSGVALVNYSDDTFAFIDDNALGFTPAAGDAYELLELEPGMVVQYKPSAADADKHGPGFVLPEKATQDTRGESWHLGEDGPLENCATIVTHFGRFRRGDIPLKHYWDERVPAINALVWTKIAAGYTNNGEQNSNFGLALSGDGGTYNTLKAFVETEYDSDSNLGTSTDPPEAGTKGSSTSDVAGGDSAFVVTIYQYLTATAPTTELASKIGWYVYATTHDDEAPVDNPPVQIVAFDSFGANIQYHAWDEYEVESSPSTASSRISGKIGRDTRPAMPSLSVPPTSGVTYVDRRGYQITDKFAIAKWNVDGGLTYCDTHD